MTLAAAPHDHRSAMELDDVLGDREPEPQAPLGPRRRAVGLTEAVEDERKEVGPYPAPGVGDGEIHPRVGPVQARADTAALSRELDRVLQDVPERLLKPIRVAAHPAGVVFDPYVERNRLRLGHRRDDLDRRTQHGRHVHLRRLDLQLPGDRTRDVEDVFDQAHLRARVALDGVEGLLGVDVRLPAQHRRPAEDRVERRPELVRDRREELVLHAVRFLRLVERTRVLQRGARSVGELLGEGQVPGSEAPARLGAGQRDRADRSPLHAQRHSHRRDEAQRAQDRRPARVGEVLMGTIVEDLLADLRRSRQQGSRPLSTPSREPPAQDGLLIGLLRVRMRDGDAAETGAAVDHVDGGPVGDPGHGDAGDRGQRRLAVERACEDVARFVEKPREPLAATPRVDVPQHRQVQARADVRGARDLEEVARPAWGQQRDLAGRLRPRRSQRAPVLEPGDAILRGHEAARVRADEVFLAPPEELDRRAVRVDDCEAIVDQHQEVDGAVEHPLAAEARLLGRPSRLLGGATLVGRTSLVLVRALAARAEGAAQERDRGSLQQKHARRERTRVGEDGGPDRQRAGSVGSDRRDRVSPPARPATHRERGCSTGAAWAPSLWLAFVHGLVCVVRRTRLAR